MSYPFLDRCPVCKFDALPTSESPIIAGFVDSPEGIAELGKWEFATCPNPECKRRLRRVKTDPPGPWLGVGEP